MSPKKAKLEVSAGKSVTAPGARRAKQPAPARPSPGKVSGRWLLLAVGGVIAVSALCAWGALCLLFWQGSWQLLYHPSIPIARTPAAARLQFDPIGFATTDLGVPRLSGWWVPAAADARFSRDTVLYLHGQDGNLGNTVAHLAQLHAAGVNVFAFDYRGYGQSRLAHPSEKHWLEDAGWALQYLTATRHIAPAAIVLDGSDLGADLALECAAAHPQLAGVVLESPLQDATNAIFKDGRARLVPARLLVSDRYNLTLAAVALRIPSLWFLPLRNPGGVHNLLSGNAEAYRNVSARKVLVWLPTSQVPTRSFAEDLSRWLDDLQTR